MKGSLKKSDYWEELSKYFHPNTVFVQTVKGAKSEELMATYLVVFGG